MKYYIPTSTSNFNCLLADESISPCGFYQKRAFGYRSFTKVPLNDNEALLPLFDSCPVFELPDDIPGFPLVLEIDSDLLDESGLKQGDCENGVAFYSKTLHFNPFNVRFVFRNQKEQIETANAAQRSIETKLLSWYRNAFVSIDSLDKKSAPEFDNLEDFADSSQEGVKQEMLNGDARKNRLKGVLWGYVIGANLSRKEKPYAELRKLLERMRNSLSAQVGGANSTGDDSTMGLHSSVNRILEKAQDAAIKEYFKPWGEESDIAFKLMFDSCPSERLEIKSAVVKAAGFFQIGPFEGSAIADVNSYVDGAIEKIAKTIYPPELIAAGDIPSVSDKEFVDMPTDDQKKDCVDDSTDERRIATYILNATLAKHSHLFIENRPSYMNEIARGIDGKCSKQYGAALNQFLKMLYDSFCGTAPLKLNEAPNDVMKSFALFCKKGSIDSLEDLECALLSNGILDLSFAYALWGAVYGYSAMPKTVIDAALSSYPKEYAEEAMRRIYEEISGKSHRKTKRDLWKEESDGLLDFYNTYLVEFDMESSRYKKYRDPEMHSFENILKECSSIDDLKKKVEETWTKPRGKTNDSKPNIRKALLENIENIRKSHDTQR